MGLKASALCYRWPLLTQKQKGEGRVSFGAFLLINAPDFRFLYWVSSVPLSKVLSIPSFQQSSSHCVSEPGIWIMTDKGQPWILLSYLRLRAGKTSECTLPWIFNFVPCKMGLNFLRNSQFEIWWPFFRITNFLSSTYTKFAVFSVTLSATCNCHWELLKICSHH